MKECNLSARASRAELIILHTQRKLSVIDRLCDVYRLHFCTVQCRKKGNFEKIRLFVTNDSASENTHLQEITEKSAMPGLESPLHFRFPKKATKM